MLLANQVGYEVLVPVVVMENLSGKKAGDPVSLYIYHQQTERQPKPVLIGFSLEVEREFFQYFLGVEAIGPLKAVRALSIPVRSIARAIETNDIKSLSNLKGIGKRTAQKIVATLRGKMDKFALINEGEQTEVAPDSDFAQQVLDVLVSQLGHRATEAKKLVTQALKRDPAISSAEGLFDEIYRGEKQKW